MYAEFRLLIGLIVAHLLWATAYVTGTLLDARAGRPATRSHALLELVVRSAAGIALWGFGAFALALVGHLDRLGLAVLLAAFVAAARVRHGAAFFGRSFWREHVERVGLAFGPTTLCLYYAALATIVPAIFPSIDSDPVRYQLAYPMDWANHGGLFLDRFLRQPLYANNFLMIFAILDVLHLQGFVHFATWLCGVLVFLAVRAALTVFDDAAAPAKTGLERWSRRAVTTLLPLAVIVPCAFLRWVDTGMVDIPMQLFTFVPVLCAVAALAARRDMRWSAVCCGAFAIGMKITLIAFAPLFVAAVWIAFRALGGTKRAAALACIIMLIGGSPWYVRNVVYDRDPVPPVVNLALHRPDLTYSPEDAANVFRDIAPDRSVEALAVLPYRMWANPLHMSLREYGTVALNLFLYVPLLVVGCGLALGARGARTQALILLSASTVYAIGYCLLTSYLMRYLLITQAPLAASIGALLLWLPGVRIAAPARVLVAGICLIPSPRAFAWYDFVWQSEYRIFEQRYTSDDAFLRTQLAGYAESEALLSTPVFRRRPAPRALLIGAETDYYFRAAGVETVGDWIGPGRFDDVRTALENDRLADYVRHFDIGGVIVKRGHPAYFDDADAAAFARALHAVGFRIIENERDGYLVAVRSEPSGHERGETR